jgi:hypothetical protein
MALFLAGNVTQARASDTLVINGKVASTDVRAINGSVYVKLADVAKALGMVVIKRADGKYEITKPGGTNQVQGVATGKVGDVLFDGRWRFQVLSVQTMASYTMKTPSVEPTSYPADTLNYNRTTQVVQPKPRYKLVVVQCRMTNGQKSTQTFWLAQKDGNNALADMEGESHVPVGYDLEGAPIQSKPLLPGAKTDFPILFIIPENTQLKDLVFTLRNNDFSQKGNDVRVSLRDEKGN